MIITNEAIESYCIKHSTHQRNWHENLVQETTEKFGSASRMQVGALEGMFLSTLALSSNAKFILEFGTFTGYSSLSFAHHLPADGRITTLDIDPKATTLAKKYWNATGAGEKTELVLGNATESILRLKSDVSTGKRPLYDLAFIDADKTGYPTYWNACLDLVKVGGIILVDNVLWSGRVLNPEDASDFAMVKFNELALHDERTQKVMLPIRDGVLFAVKLN